MGPSPELRVAALSASACTCFCRRKSALLCWRAGGAGAPLPFPFTLPFPLAASPGGPLLLPVPFCPLPVPSALPPASILLEPPPESVPRGPDTSSDGLHSAQLSNPSQNRCTKNGSLIYRIYRHHAFVLRRLRPQQPANRLFSALKINLEHLPYERYGRSRNSKNTEVVASRKTDVDSPKNETKNR